jgi:TorA maturation chaperone TorD
MSALVTEVADRGLELEARAALLEYVAELWLAPAEERHLAGLRALEELFPGTGFSRFADPDRMGELRTAFDVHMRIPGGRALLPYESSHLPDQERFRGPERIADVASIYFAAGFDMDPFTQFPADHLGHELRFVAALLRREATLAPGSPAAVNALGWRTGFIREHPGLVIQRFVARTQAVGAHPFFVGLADVTEALLTQAEELPPQV